jgi:hypothetical protein
MRASPELAPKNPPEARPEASVPEEGLFPIPEHSEALDNPESPIFPIFIVIEFSQTFEG